jgi:hypothetical protein
MTDTSPPQDPSHAIVGEALRAIERTRLAALVRRDIERARPLHAADFQLITPVGLPLSKDQYLGAIAAGALTYAAWDPQQIEVRWYGQAAALRYRSSLEVTFGAHHVPRADYWHTDLYEQRGGAWQVVWSQATEIRPVPAP